MSSSSQSARRPQPSIHFPTRAGERTLRGSRRTTSVSRSMSRTVSGATTAARFPLGATARPGDACRPGVSSFSGGANPAAIPGRATVRIVPSAPDDGEAGGPDRLARSQQHEQLPGGRDRPGHLAREPQPAAAPCACGDRPRRPRDPGPRAARAAGPAWARFRAAPGRTRADEVVRRRAHRPQVDEAQLGNASVAERDHAAGRRARDEARGCAVPMSIRWPTGASVRASSRASMPRPSQLTPSTTALRRGSGRQPCNDEGHRCSCNDDPEPHAQ